MTRIRNAVFTLAAGIITAGMTVPSAAAQSAEPSAQFMPGQPVVVSVADPELGTLEIVWAGRVPLADGRRVRLALPDLGQRGLAYAVSTQGLEPDAAKKHQSAVGRIHTVYIKSPGSGAILGGGSSSSSDGDDGLADGGRKASGLSGDAGKKPQHVVGRLHASHIASPATPILGAGGGKQAGQGDMILTIGAQGIQVDFGYDLSDDIVWDDPCVFGGMKPAGSADQVGDSGASLGDGNGQLSGGGAGSKSVSTSTGTTGLAGA